MKFPRKTRAIVRQVPLASTTGTTLRYLMYLSYGCANSAEVESFIGEIDFGFRTAHRAHSLSRDAATFLKFLE